MDFVDFSAPAAPSANDGAFLPTSSEAPQPRPFLSAQRRYDNMRIRENEIKHRVCFDCGRVIHGDDLVFQHHMITHEAAFICYQLYHFEKGTTLPRHFLGRTGLKFMKPANPPSKSGKKKKKETSLREQLQRQILKGGKLSLPMPPPKQPLAGPKLTKAGQPQKKRGPKPKTDGKDRQFINDRPLVAKSSKQESDDESDQSHVTDDDEGSEASFKSEPDIEMPVDDLDEDYQPPSQPSTSSRGRPRKPKLN